MSGRSTSLVGLYVQRTPEVEHAPLGLELQLHAVATDLVRAAMNPRSYQGSSSIATKQPTSLPSSRSMMNLASPSSQAKKLHHDLDDLVF